jgi:5-hydroxyisourate hydrolase-like protein (transthyretin family)
MPNPVPTSPNSPTSPQPSASSKTKPILWLLFGVLLTLGILFLLLIFLYLFSRYTSARLSKPQRMTYELPKDFDPKALTAVKLSIINQKVAEKYPSHTFMSPNGKEHKFLVDITLTANEKPIPYGSPVWTDITPTPSPQPNTITPTHSPTASPTPTNSPTPTPTNTPTPTPYMDHLSPSPADHLSPTPTPTPGAQGQDTVTFTYTGNCDGTLITKVKDATEMYYPQVSEILGTPYSNGGRNVTIFCDANDELMGYYPQIDTLVVAGADPYEIVPGLASIVFGPYYSLIPQTWRYGIVYGVTYLIGKTSQTFDPRGIVYIEDIAADYEKFNYTSYPIWGTTVEYASDIIPMDYRIFTAMSAILKPYYYDASFFKNLKNKLFEKDIASTLWFDDVGLFADVSSAFPPKIEGSDPTAWYAKQQVLHQTITDPMATLLMQLVGQTFVVEHRNLTVVNNALVEENAILGYKFKTVFTANGLSFVPRAGQSIKFKVKDNANSEVSSQDLTTDQGGRVRKELSQVNITQTGLYAIDISDTNSKVYFNYRINAASDFNGVVVRFGPGTVVIGDPSVNPFNTVPLENGAFFGMYPRGVVVVKPYDANNQPTYEKEVVKTVDRYFAIIEFGPWPQVSSPTVVVSPPTRGKTDCSTGWDEFMSEKFGISLKIPPGWSQDLAYTQESESTLRVEYISTKEYQEQLDPKNPISHFTVVVSKNDLKTDETYKQWFDDPTGLQKKEQTTFQGTPAEKYTVTAPMPAGDYFRESYYFSRGGYYYYFDVGIYVTAALKEANEKIKDCFFQTVSITGSPVPEKETSPSPTPSGSLIKCSPEQFSTSEGILAQADWQTYQDPCEKLAEDIVCGRIRSVYDNGQESQVSNEYRNTCSYCAFFDKNGFRELRGTKMYALGYTKGRCP